MCPSVCPYFVFQYIFPELTLGFSNVIGKNLKLKLSARITPCSSSSPFSHVSPPPFFFFVVIFSLQHKHGAQSSGKISQSITYRTCPPISTRVVSEQYRQYFEPPRKDRQRSLSFSSKLLFIFCIKMVSFLLKIFKNPLHPPFLSHISFIYGYIDP